MGGGPAIEHQQGILVGIARNGRVLHNILYAYTRTHAHVLIVLLRSLFEHSDIALQVMLSFEFPKLYLPLKLEMERNEIFQIEVRYKLKKIPVLC